MKEFFPFDSFRDGQAELLDTLEANWDKYDCFVVRAPVGFGKSPISATIQARELEAGNGCCILTPNNMLRKQYLNDYDWMQTVKSQDEYWIEKYNMTEREYRKRIYKWGPKDSEYKSDYQAVRRKGTAVVGNFYTYLAHKLQRHTLIVDEAHSLLGTLQDLAAKRIWQHEYRYPKDARTFGDLLQWVGRNPSDSKLQRLKQILESSTTNSLLRFAVENHRGAAKECLKMIPLSVSDLPNPFWGGKVEKIILMSATIGPMDIEKMGLSSRRVFYVDVSSPIPVERRPILFQPIGNMSYSSQDENIEKLAQELLALADHHQTKGFVHAPYSLAKKLKPFLSSDKRFIFHGRGDDKQEKYDKFYAMPLESGAVMIGSGMHEGLDLKYGVAEWQALTKVPYPSLADPAMRHIAEEDPDYYNWYVSKDVMQASGRICRAPDDEGITYLLDSQFESWYSKYSNSLPDWFTQAVEGM
jgi:Rad3-related DNA helicase